MANDDRAVLVTGCSSGIGYTTAHVLKARGYRVFASARKAEDVDRLTGEGLETLQLDMDDSASIAAAVAELLARTGGRIYGLFNNAGFGQPGAVEDVSREALRTQFETNFFGPHELIGRVLPVMRRQGHGRIIQHSSVLGFVSLKYRGAYCASKHAMEGMADALRMELAGTDIHVAIVQPGPILTKFRDNAFKAYRRNIDKEQSHFRAMYQAMEDRLQKEGPAVPFTLPPEAVAKKVVHALEAKRPRTHYPVTFPTYLFGLLKRVLTARRVDRLLARF